MSRAASSFACLAAVIACGCSVAQTQTQPLPQPSLQYWLDRLKGENMSERVDAVLHLADFGDHSEEIFLPLVESVVDPDALIPQAAQWTIDRLATPLTQTAIEWLDRTDSKSFSAACEMIHRIGPPAAPALDKLIPLLESDDRGRRQAALFACVNLKSPDERLKCLAIRFLEDEDFRNQVLACRILADYGPAAREAAQPLLKLIEIGNPSARSHALRTLGAVGPIDGIDSVKILVQHLDAFLQPERERALFGLSSLGPAAAAAREPVEKLMNDPEKSVHCPAAIALWKITGNPQPSVDALLKAVETVDFEEEAILALGQMGPAAAASLDFLMNKLDNPDASYRAMVAAAIGRIGPHPAARQRLQQIAQNDEDPLARLRAAEALTHEPLKR